MDVDIRQGQVDLMFGYQAGDWSIGVADSGAEKSPSPDLILDVMGGVRYVYLKQDIDFSPGPDLGGDKEWIEPVVGARLILETATDFYFLTRGDISGFGVPEGSDLTWNLIGGVGYQPWDRASLGLGYRVYSIDYSDGDGADEFGWDATLLGPYFTFVYQF